MVLLAFMREALPLLPGIMAVYNHSIAVIMTTAALHTGVKITFDEEGQEVMAGNTIFTY